LFNAVDFLQNNVLLISPHLNGFFVVTGGGFPYVILAQFDEVSASGEVTFEGGKKVLTVL
jgi:hypothetical protein